MRLKDRLSTMPVVGTALRLQDRYVRDAADQLAAAMAFFGFLSLFPLMIVALGVTGQMLAGRPDLQADMVEGILGAVPGFDAARGATEVGALVDSIVVNRGALGALGAATLLLSGLRVVDAAMAATTLVFGMPRPRGAMRVRRLQLGALVVLGSLTLLSTSAGGLVGATGVAMPAAVRAIVIPLLTVGIDVVLFAAAYRMLARGDGQPATRHILVGAVYAAVGWTALKVFGATFVAHQLASANAVYGPLAGVVALLVLLYLAGRLYLYGAELIMLRVERAAAATAAAAGQGRAGVAWAEAVGDATVAAARAARPTIVIAAGSIGPRDPSPAISAKTRQRLARLDADRHAGPGRGPRS